MTNHPNRNPNYISLSLPIVEVIGEPVGPNARTSTGASSQREEHTYSAMDAAILLITPIRRKFRDAGCAEPVKIEWAEYDQHHNLTIRLTCSGEQAMVRATLDPAGPEIERSLRARVHQSDWTPIQRSTILG